MEWRDGLHSNLTCQTREKDRKSRDWLSWHLDHFFLFEMLVWLSLLLRTGLVWLEDIWCVAWHVWHGRNLALTSQPIQCLQSGCDPVTNRPRLKTPPLAMVELSLEPRAIKLALGTTLLSGLVALRLGTLVLVVIGGVHLKLYHPFPLSETVDNGPPDSLGKFFSCRWQCIRSWSTLFVTGGCCPSKHASVTWREIEDIRWSYLMSIHCYLRFSPRCLVLRRFATAGPRSRGFLRHESWFKNQELRTAIFFQPLVDSFHSLHLNAPNIRSLLEMEYQIPARCWECCWEVRRVCQRLWCRWCIRDASGCLPNSKLGET